MRAFWKGDPGTLADFKANSGSGDHFNKRGRRPSASVNFVTAHDGFNLNDLVSYNDKHNEANGEDNRDGNSNNHSWNCGAEGQTVDPDIRSLRERQKRNLIARCLSHGTPMLLAGDEFEIPSKATTMPMRRTTRPPGSTGWASQQTVEACANSHESHRHAQGVSDPLRSRFLVGSHNEELDIKDVTWLSPSGEEMTTEQWQDGNAKCFGMLLDGRAQETGIKRRGSDATCF